MSKFSNNTVANLMNNQTTKASHRRSSKSALKVSRARTNDKSAIRLPMSCTLDVHTIGKLQAMKQTLHLHNRDQVINKLMTTPFNKLLTTSTQKHDYKLYYQVYLMQNKPKAITHYHKFYSHR